jgi:cell division protease FtsH
MIYGQKEELVFLGREIGEQRDYSEAVAEEIDEEVRRIISEAYGRARKLLGQQREKLELVAETLLEVETLDRQEFEALLGEAKARPEGEEEESTPIPFKEKATGSKDESEDSPPSLNLPPAPAPA